ncbi:MAG: hypothetical protein WCH46_01275 [bacterium]
MKKFLLIILALSLLAPSIGLASRGHRSSSTTHSTRSHSTRSHTSSPKKGKKTQNVSGYTKKNGTHVKAYKRRAPN